MRRLLLLPCLLGLAALPAVTAANTATPRYASPTGKGDCTTAEKACSLATAIGAAVPGDEVRVLGGNYSVGAALTPAAGVHVVGWGARPVIEGNLTVPVLSLSAGSTARHLALRATGPFAATSSPEAISLHDALGEDLLLESVNDQAAALKADTGGETVLRDSVARGGTAAVKLADTKNSTGTVSMVNVTAVGRTALLTKSNMRSATVRNSVLLGGTADIEVGSGFAPTVSHSNLRAGAASYVDGGGNRSTSPALDGALRPLAGSPTIDGGTASGALGAVDPDGSARVIGPAPDAGAYEWTGESPASQGPAAGATAGEGTDPASRPRAPLSPLDVPAPANEPLPGLPAPVLGASVQIAPAAGQILVRRPGAAGFVELGAATTTPVGSVFDARRGAVTLRAALPGGAVQGGTFGGGRFQLRQKPGGDGMTDIVLRGGSFRTCRTSRARAAGGPVARTAARRRKKVRGLWTRDRGGRFRTHGRNSVASARGTAWSTVDRCDGTLTRVSEAAVVVRPRSGGRPVLVRAGRSYLARSRR